MTTEFILEGEPEAIKVRQPPMELTENEQLFVDYAVLNAEIAQLEKQRDEKKQAIIALMKQTKVETYSHAAGVFSRCKRTTWRYSDAVDQAIGELDIMKAHEVEHGVAKPIVTEFMAFRVKKS